MKSWTLLVLDGFRPFVFDHTSTTVYFGILLNIDMQRPLSYTKGPCYMFMTRSVLLPAESAGHGSLRRADRKFFGGSAARRLRERESEIPARHVMNIESLFTPFYRMKEGLTSRSKDEVYSRIIQGYFALRPFATLQRP